MEHGNRIERHVVEVGRGLQNPVHFTVLMLIVQLQPTIHRPIGLDSRDELEAAVEMMMMGSQS